MYFKISFIILSFLTLLISWPALATEQKKVNISASIGHNQVTIYGLTSPNSRVELSSTRVFATTYSDDIGNFIFDKTLLPKNPSDLCLTAIDNSQVRTTPVCIPPPPATNYQTNIGPILLPPTISLDTANISPNGTAVVSGLSIPNSTVDIFFFQKLSRAKIFPKSAQAFSLPKVTTIVSADGRYTLNLPTAYSSDYRVYAGTSIYDFASPKSNILLFKLPSFWYLLLVNYKHQILLSIILTLAIGILIYLIYLSKHDRKYRTNISK